MKVKLLIITLLLACAPIKSYTSSYAKAVYNAAATGGQDKACQVLCWQARYGQNPREITDQALSHAIYVNDCRTTRELTHLYNRLSCNFLCRHYLFFSVLSGIVGAALGINAAQKALGHSQQ